ncbi:hypothetical protein [Pseudomonas sp. GOM6]|uniref:hypothetical protein n=1 Tax=Pseudomonas sp. GOM6 TaxID=3036944 RepID=UPI00240A73F0|nr:hypothetical protein [Pseudomonas sp. GOM6]MDG1580950.1 hypothetical protein [Pseudomonas sp. GOM6]
MTLAQRFIEKARELVPQHDDLQSIDPAINDASVIDETMFRRGEYLGGMATAILAILSREDRVAPPGTYFATKAQFEDALRRVLGDEVYRKLAKSGFSTADFCREVAQKAFLGGIENQNAKQADLNLIRCVAHRLWNGDGTSGLSS